MKPGFKPGAAAPLRSLKEEGIVFLHLVQGRVMSFVNDEMLICLSFLEGVADKAIYRCVFLAHDVGLFISVIDLTIEFNRLIGIVD